MDTVQYSIPCLKTIGMLCFLQCIYGTSLSTKRKKVSSSSGLHSSKMVFGSYFPNVFSKSLHDVPELSNKNSRKKSRLFFSSETKYSSKFSYLDFIPWDISKPFPIIKSTLFANSKSSSSKRLHIFQHMLKRLQILSISWGVERFQVNSDVSTGNHDSSSIPIFSIKHCKLLSCCARLIAPVARKVSNMSFCLRNNTRFFSVRERDSHAPASQAFFVSRVNICADGLQVLSPHNTRSNIHDEGAFSTQKSLRVAGFSAPGPAGRRKFRPCVEKWCMVEYITNRFFVAIINEKEVQGSLEWLDSDIPRFVRDI